jgi:hypothetical protein
MASVALQSKEHKDHFEIIDKLRSKVLVDMLTCQRSSSAVSSQPAKALSLRLFQACPFPPRITSARDLRQNWSCYTKKLLESRSPLHLALRGLRMSGAACLAFSSTLMPRNPRRLPNHTSPLVAAVTLGLSFL